MSKVKTTMEVDEYIQNKIDQLNNNAAGHLWVCVEFNKSKWAGKALCISHKHDSFREYTNL